MGSHRLISAVRFFLWILPAWAGQVCNAHVSYFPSESTSHAVLDRTGAPTAHQQQPEYQIEVESSLVLLDVLVTDEDGNVLSGLKQGNFRILDDGKPQVIASFGPTEDPITIVMLLEYSGLAYNYFAYKGRPTG
jgi:hypothetical protein